jgi:hypothetical protein
MGQGYVKFDEQGARRAVLEIAASYSPRNAVREFVTNGLDGKINDRRVDISVVLHQKDRRIIISDNGTGMTYQELAERSEKIGNSGKFEKIDKRGEKAYGLLAFGSLGEAMHIISRSYTENTQKYGYVFWEKTKEGIPFRDSEIEPEKVDRMFNGVFPFGTRIIVDRVNPHLFEKVLTVPTLKAWLEQLYAPALNKGIANISVGKIDEKSGKPRMQGLDVPHYETDSSTELMDEVIPVRIKGQPELGQLEVVLFVDPQASGEKVAIYSKDVRVYDSVAELTEFGRSPTWTSGKVTGYINDHFNKLILGRDGIDRQRNAFKAWYETVRQIEERIAPIVEEKKKHGKKMKEDSYIRKAFDALADAWKDLKKIEGDNERYIRSDEGVDTPVRGISPNENGGRNPHGSGPRKPRVNSPEPPGAFEPHEGGIIIPVVRRAGIPFACPQPIEFPLSERDLRSKLDDTMANPMLYLNSIHENYKEREGQKDSEFIRYVVELISKEASYYKMRKAQKEKRLFGDSLDLVNIALQEAENLKFLALKRLGIK